MATGTLCCLKDIGAPLVGGQLRGVVEYVLGEKLEAAVVAPLQEPAQLLEEVGPVGIAGHLNNLNKCRFDVLLSF